MTDEEDSRTPRKNPHRCLSGIGSYRVAGAGRVASKHAKYASHEPSVEEMFCCTVDPFVERLELAEGGVQELRAQIVLNHVQNGAGEMMLPIIAPVNKIENLASTIVLLEAKVASLEGAPQELDFQLPTQVEDQLTNLSWVAVSFPDWMADLESKMTSTCHSMKELHDCTDLAIVRVEARFVEELEQ